MHCACVRPLVSGIKLLSAKQPALAKVRSSAAMAYGSFAYEVHGLVQGVFFRDHTRKRAAKLGVVGHIRNTAQGTVAGEAQGEQESIKQFKTFLKTEGSPGSRIDKADITNEKEVDQLSYDKFETRH